jgi:hypothetical protein
MSNVTVSGTDGTTVSIPWSSTDSAAIAQAALSGVTGLVGAGEMTIATYAAGDSLSSGDLAYSGISVTVPGTTLFNSVPDNNAFLSVDGSATVAAIGGGAPTTVVSGAQSSLVYYNNSEHATILLGGGCNYIAQNADSVSAVINVAGSATLGIGGAVIDAHQGSATINLSSNAVVNLEAGGSNLIHARAGTELLQIGGTSTVPVTVTGASGSQVEMLNQNSAFIEPGAGNFILLPGSTGTATLFGGTRTFGGTTYTGHAFTGSATVLGGTGYFEGGSAGNNILFSSTVNGATTLIGGGNNDYLASFASGDSLVGGAGSDIMVGWNTTGSGNTFISGGGSDTIFGSATGNNVIGLGADTTLAYGQHNTIDSLTGNRYFQAKDGGTSTIGDFLVGYDVFSLSLSSSSTGQNIGVKNIESDGSGGTRATLTDGSTITFLHAIVTANDFKTTT